ncbi:MAG: hypothetical protein HYT72_02265 [Candidatus Aenigmarchaeota archaeon]|nr:hypothetical protein [Candidatus Aenigmarchaeota archaeon]
MVKTTLEIKDETYRRLVEASLRRYGNARSISKMANEVIEAHLKEPEIEKAAADDAIKKRMEIVRKSAGSWKIGETGAEYVRNIRKESEKRLKRMGL